MTTIFPRASSSCTRTGRTSMIRASACRSLVMIPDWLPVKLTAAPPSSRMAIDSSAIEMRSPAVSSMSSSRRSGFAETCFARPSRSSVVSPIAETTTTTSRPSRRVRITRSATCFSFATSATLDPPYFCTTMAIPAVYGLSRNSACRDREGTHEEATSCLLRDRKVSCLRGCMCFWTTAGLAERRRHRRVVARADIFLHGAGRRPRGQRLAREHVIEPPADIPLPHVAPRRPPGEQSVVVGIERAADVHEAASDEALDDRALLRQLADRARLPFLRMHVAFGARDVHVPHQRELPAGRLKRRRIRIHRLEKLHLRAEVLAAVRDVHRRHGQIAGRGGDLYGRDPALVIEAGMRKGRSFRGERLADVEGDARVAFAAVPIAPVALHLAESGRHLIRGGFDFLQADDVRALVRDPVVDLCLTRPDTVDVPGG